MKRFFQSLGTVLGVLILAYLLGPRPPKAVLADQPVRLATALPQLEQEIRQAEKAAGIRPDNEARIFWADSLQKQKTPYSFVYLHGFSASWAEGDPIHRRLARHFGGNLYVARLAGHGLQSPDAMKTLTPTDYVASAERALAIGRALGEKVVLVGTSAGGMLALLLASRHPDLHSVVLYSPCIEVATPALKLVTGPWGKQLVDRVMGSEYITFTHYSSARAGYWYPRYHTNGLVTLQSLLEACMVPETFARVRQPLFMGYYYKDEDHQDKVVSVAAMLAMYDQLGTPVDKKRRVAFPQAGEHVISSHFTAKDLDGVYRESERFLREVAGLQPAVQSGPTLAFDQKK